MISVNDNKMSCTAEEIAEKRRIAIERLNARKNALNNNNGAGTATAAAVPKPAASTVSTKPTFTLPPKQQQAIEAHKASSFYGKSSNTTAPNFKQIVTNGATSSGSSSSSGGGKIRNPFNNARPQTQPYARNSPAASNAGKIAPVFVRTVTCCCAMVSETRFIVQPSGFNDKLIEVFKSIPSKQYGRYLYI